MGECCKRESTSDPAFSIFYYLHRNIWLRAIANFQHSSTVTHIFQNIAETLKSCGPAILSDTDGHTMLEIATQLVMVLSKQHPAQVDDMDEEDMPDLAESSEYDWMLVDASMDVLLGLAIALGPQYAQIWTISASHVIKYASSTEPRERSTAIGVIADSIKYMEKEVTPFTEKLLALLLHRIGDEDQDVKANAAYALGLLCLHSADRTRILAQYNTILYKLERFLTRSPDSTRLLDNAAGCLARMIIASPDRVPLAEVLPALLNILPLTEDFEENEPVYKMLVKLYQAGNQVVFEMTQGLLPVFSHVLADGEQLDKDTRAELVELVRWLHSKQPGVVAAWPVLAAAVV